MTSEIPYHGWRGRGWLRAGLHLLAGLALSLLAACEEGDSEAYLAAIDVARAGFTSLAVTPADLVVSVDESAQLIASAARNGSTASDVTGRVSWASSAPAIVAVGATGRVTGIADGSAIITARLADLSASVTVRSSSAALQSISIGVAGGGPASTGVCASLQLQATGSFENEAATRDISNRVIWTSATPADAEFSSREGEAGLLRGLAAADVNVSASLDTVQSPLLTVTFTDTLQGLAVAPQNATLTTGATLQYRATASYADSSTLDITSTATWSSSNTGVASIGNRDTTAGLARGLSSGTSTIGASCNGFSDATTLNVTLGRTLVKLEIENDENPIVLTSGSTPTLTAVAIYTDTSREDVTEDADWSIDPDFPSTIEVSNEDGSRGEVTILSTGLSILRVEFGGEVVTVPVEVR